MIRTLIVEDERRAREALKSLLAQYFENVEVVDTADSVDSALKSVKKHNPDLVLLDIEMPEADSFEFLEKVPEINFEIIFTTAYDKYAVRAFKFSAVDYLLKPIDIDKLKTALDKLVVKSLIKLDKQRIDFLLASLNNNQNQLPKKIALPTSDGMLFVAIEEIIRCEAEENYTMFWMKDGSKVMVSKVLKTYVEMLSDVNFFRVHQSHLINLAYIKKYIRTGGSRVQMTDDSEVPVSHRTRSSFLKKLEEI